MEQTKEKTMDKSDRVKGWESVLKCALYSFPYPLSLTECINRASVDDYKERYSFQTLSRIIAIRASKREWVEATSFVESPMKEITDVTVDHIYRATNTNFEFGTVALEVADFIKQCPDLQPTKSMFRNLTDEIHEQYVEYVAWLGTQKPDDVVVDPENGDTIAEAVDEPIAKINASAKGLVQSMEDLGKALDGVFDTPEGTRQEVIDGEWVTLGIRETLEQRRSCVTAVFKS